VLISSEFQTVGAAGENAHIDIVVAAVVELMPNMILLLDDTPQFLGKDMACVITASQHLLFCVVSA